MKPLRLEDLVDIDTYSRVREEYRPRVIAHKNRRRASVGPSVSMVFEDRETLRYQIQEMTRIEHTTDPEKIQIELDVYNELMPGESELSATLFIEIPDLERVQPELDRLIGIDEHVCLLVDGFEAEPVMASFDDRQMEEDRISAVHYVRFELSPDQVEAWKAGAGARLLIDHPNYHHEVQLGAEVRESLSRDLAGNPIVLLRPEDLREARPASEDVILETERIRARRLSPAGAPLRIVVEAVRPEVSLLDAEPELLAELLGAAQRIAREIQERDGGAHVRLDLLAGEPGQLRLELTARK